MKKIFFLAIFLFVLLSISDAKCTSSYDDVTNFVQSTSDTAIKIASDESVPIEKRREKLADLFNETVDLDWVSRFIMGKHWRTADEEKRREFVSLYREYLIKKYAPKFNGYNGRDFKILSVESPYENEYTVKSEYIGEDNKRVNIDFFVMKSEKDGRFYINDFVAEGISFIVSQRSEISSVITNKGLDAFLEELRQRLQEKSS